MMPTKKRRILWGVAGALLVALIGVMFYLKSVSDYKQTVRNMTFREIDIAQIADGAYLGACDVNFISAKVNVTVQDGKIAHIAILEHKNDRGTPAEPVIDTIVAQQKIDVETIAGATNSSIVLKKAVENALTQ